MSSLLLFLLVHIGPGLEIVQAALKQSLAPEWNPWAPVVNEHQGHEQVMTTMALSPAARFLCDLQATVSAVSRLDASSTRR